MYSVYPAIIYTVFDLLFAIFRAKNTLIFELIALANVIQLSHSALYDANAVLSTKI